MKLLLVDEVQAVFGGKTANKTTLKKQPGRVRRGREESRGGGDANSRLKIVPMDDVLWHVLYSVVQEERVPMSVHGEVDLVVKRDLVDVVPKREALGIVGDLVEVGAAGKRRNSSATVSKGEEGDRDGSQQDLGVRDGPHERSSRPEVARDVVEHHPRLLLGLKRVVHAELHRDGVDRVLEEALLRDDFGDGFLWTDKTKKRRSASTRREMRRK